MPTRSRFAPLLALGALAACGAPADDGLSAVLITLDTTRTDALSCYGGRWASTPVLDRLADEGVLYERAHTTVPITLPAHASMLTGLWPVRHGVRDNALVPLPAAADTLAELASTEGIATAAFVSAVVLDGVFGLDQGFDVYREPGYRTLDATSRIPEIRADEVVDRALEWLAGRDRERRFFLWVHFFDPHGPYDPPEAWRTPELSHRGGYDGEVAFVDHELGRLLGALETDGSLARSLVLVVGDHGEAFGEHGEQSHGTYCYQPTLRVPLILRHPDGRRAGLSSDETVSVADVFPTLLDALGIEVPAGVDGRSLLAGPVPAERGVYFESYQGWLSYEWSPLSGWLDARTKYVHGSEPELFDVVRDRGETTNLASGRPAEAERARAALRAVAALPRLPSNADAGVEDALRETIAGLGYAAAAAGGREVPDPGAPSALPSPAARHEEHRTVLRAMELLNLGLEDPARFAEAEGLLREVLRANPRNWFARDRLAIALVQEQRYDEAIELLGRLLAEGPRWPNSAFNLGVSLLEAGREDEAPDAFLTAVAADPRIARDVAALPDHYRAEGREELAAFLERFLSAHDLRNE